MSINELKKFSGGYLVFESDDVVELGHLVELGDGAEEFGENEVHLVKVVRIHLDLLLLLGHQNRAFRPVMELKSQVSAVRVFFGYLEGASCDEML